MMLMKMVGIYVVHLNLVGAHKMSHTVFAIWVICLFGLGSYVCLVLVFNIVKASNDLSCDAKKPVFRVSAGGFRPGPTQTSLYNH